MASTAPPCPRSGQSVIAASSGGPVPSALPSWSPCRLRWQKGGVGRCSGGIYFIMSSSACHPGDTSSGTPSLDEPHSASNPLSRLPALRVDMRPMAGADHPPLPPSRRAVLGGLAAGGLVLLGGRPAPAAGSWMPQSPPPPIHFDVIRNGDVIGGHDVTFEAARRRRARRAHPHRHRGQHAGGDGVPLPARRHRGLARPAPAVVRQQDAWTTTATSSSPAAPQPTASR